jgi:peptidoglycan/LPS O-acetylase OafA/YrhL
MEWWFYMGFAGIAFFGRIPKLAIGLVAVGVFIAAFNFTVGMLAYVWVLGSLAAVLWNQTTKVPKKLWMVSLVVFLFLALYRLKIAAWSFYDLQTCLLIGTAFFSASKAIENWPVPVWLTKIGAGCAAFSYSLYLIHYTVMTAVPGWRALLLSNILAVLMWFLFERHYHAVARLLRSGRRAG